MAYRKVIVTISGNESDAVAVETAVRLADPGKGLVVALYARGETGAAAQFRYPTLGETFFTQIQEAASSATTQRETDARALFEQQWNGAVQKGESSISDPAMEWITEDGDVPEAIVRQGGIYDLLVLGQTARKDPYVMEAALFHSGRPVLVASRRNTPRRFSNVMIGWNQSAQAGKSVVDAVPLLQRAERVTICTVRTLAKPGPSAEECADYLRVHGIEAEVRNLDPSGSSVGALLLDEAGRVDADVLVTGANYQSRLQELMPGGVTGYLIQNADIAFLMSH